MPTIDESYDETMPNESLQSPPPTNGARQIERKLADTDTPEGISEYAEERICNGLNRKK